MSALVAWISQNFKARIFLVTQTLTSPAFGCKSVAWQIRLKIVDKDIIPKLDPKVHLKSRPPNMTKNHQNMTREPDFLLRPEGGVIPAF